MNITTKFSVGDRVYCAQALWSARNVECADCGGTGKWRVVTATGEFDCPCSICAGPWEEIRGYVEVYDFRPEVTPMTIGHVRVETGRENGEVVYMCEETGIGSGTLWDESRLFSDRADAVACAEIEVERRRKEREERDERERKQKKEKRIRRRAA